MHKRYSEIDALRGLAVLLMVASHVVWFQSNNTNGLWNFFRSWGDSVCYITFLFVFGITLYLTTVRDQEKGNANLSVRRRVLMLLGIYYLVAFVSVVSELNSIFDPLILKTLFFINVPGFTEFLIPFLLYTIGLYILLRFVSLRLMTSVTGLVVSSVISTVGLLVFLNVGDIKLPFGLESYMALLWGHRSLLRFGLFEYMPILVAGLYFGRKIHEGGDTTLFNSNLVKGMLALYLGTVFLWFTSVLGSFKYLNEFNRWPPSLLFLAVGFTFALFGLWMFRNIIQGMPRKIFEHLGKNSLPILAFHLIFLQLLRMIGIPRTGSFLILLGLFIIALFGYSAIQLARNTFNNEHAA